MKLCEHGCRRYRCKDYKDCKDSKQNIYILAKKAKQCIDLISLSSPLPI